MGLTDILGLPITIAASIITPIAVAISGAVAGIVGIAVTPGLIGLINAIILLIIIGIIALIIGSVVFGLALIPATPYVLIGGILTTPLVLIGIATFLIISNISALVKSISCGKGAVSHTMAFLFGPLWWIHYIIRGRKTC